MCVLLSICVFHRHVFVGDILTGNQQQALPADIARIMVEPGFLTAAALTAAQAQHSDSIVALVAACAQAAGTSPLSC